MAKRKLRYSKEFDLNESHELVLTCWYCQAEKKVEIFYGDNEKELFEDVDLCWVCDFCFSELPRSFQINSIHKLKNHAGHIFEKKSFENVPVEDSSSRTVNNKEDSWPSILVDQALLFMIKLFAAIKIRTISHIFYCHLIEVSSVCLSRLKITKNVHLRILFSCLFVVVCLILFYLCLKSVSQTSANDSLEKNKAKLITHSFKKLAREFPDQDLKLWISLSAGFKDILNEDYASPGVFLFLHSNTHPLDCILMEVSKLAHDFLNVSQDPLILDGNNFENKMMDPGQLIVDYKEEIHEKKISIIKNLQLFPSQIAKAFHFIVDTYNPLVPKALYLLTVLVDKSSLSQYNEMEMAEKVLFGVWNDKDDEIIKPLITRLTLNTLKINEGFKFDYTCS